jgi:hypothetical protein
MVSARVALVLAFVAASQSADAEPCVPRADLAGDADAVARVAVELTRLGVDVHTSNVPSRPRPASCPAIVAAVELERNGGIAVAVRDASQRSEGRVVSDAALAAAWIDSWLRDDFSVPAVEPALSPPMATPSTPVAEPVVEIVQTTVSTLDTFAITATLLQAWSGGTWNGFAGSACVRTGDACIGGRFAYAQQTVTTAQLTGAAKHDVSLVATLSYPQQIGAMSVAPELGLGVGRRTTTRVEGCKSVEMPMCDPMTDPTCGQMPGNENCSADTGVIYVGDNFAATHYTPRVAAALRVAIPLFDHVWLDGLAAATLAPLSHTGDYAGKSPDGNTGPNAGAYPLPGDAMLGLSLGIGVRVGAR